MFHADYIPCSSGSAGSMERFQVKTSSMARILLVALAFGFFGKVGSAAVVYDQPAGSGGEILLSSWWSPEGDDHDQYIWDNFTLSMDQQISQISWRGGFDPMRFGSGGPVLDFTLSIYASISAGTQPDVTKPPLRKYSTGGNANQTRAGTFEGTSVYDYTFTLPESFSASAGAKYWLQIQAAQNGIPDWGLAKGSGGDGSHFRKIVLMGDNKYQVAQGDAAFRLASAASEPAPVIFKFGALESTDSGPLHFLNGELYTSGSGWVMTLLPSSGLTQGQYEWPVLMKVLAATPANGGPEPHHAALGSCLEMQLLSLAGPPQGRLSVWEAGQARPQLTVATGDMTGSDRLRLSATGGESSSDPYGYVLGRRFMVSHPGLYSLSFKVVDTSTNGPDGGPIHTPSEPYTVYLQAGIVIASLIRESGSITATFGSEPGRSYYLERAAQCSVTALWQAIAGPLRGDGRMQTLIDTAANEAQHYYRLRTLPP